MKKYKLIKNYPGCGYNINQVIETKFIWDKHGQKVYLKDYPEFWEEVVEKDYEILSYQSKDKIIAPATNFAIEISKPGYWDIHSVKRLSDGEVFTVGDKVSSTNNVYTGGLYNQNKISNNKAGKWANRFYDIPIKNFKFVNNKLCVFFDDPLNYGQPIEFINKVKQPLFTTEDGVNLFEGDKFYYITKNFEISSEVTPIKKECSKHSYNNLLKYCKLLNLKFSTKEAAEEHVLMNTLKLSIADVERELINGCDRNPSKTNGSKTLKLLKELVKSRL